MALKTSGMAPFGFCKLRRPVRRPVLNVDCNMKQRVSIPALRPYKANKQGKHSFVEHFMQLTQTLELKSKIDNEASA